MLPDIPLIYRRKIIVIVFTINFLKHIQNYRYITDAFALHTIYVYSKQKFNILIFKFLLIYSNLDSL